MQFVEQGKALDFVRSWQAILAESGGAYEVIGPAAPFEGSQAPVLVLCDHAASALPAEYGTLGLTESEFSRHIAYDIGARDTALALSARLGTAAVLTRYSRLLIDCNRGLDDPTLVMRLSDGAVIPGNRQLDAEERTLRIERFWRPYHDAVDRIIDVALASGRVPVLVSIHTFTPLWRGVARPWHVGILWDKDPRVARILLQGLRADSTLVVGDNEPYSGRLEGDCLYRHGTSRGLPHALVEIRQDLVADAGHAHAWGHRLAEILLGALADPAASADIRQIGDYGSVTAPVSVRQAPG